MESRQQPMHFSFIQVMAGLILKAQTAKCVLRHQGWKISTKLKNLKTITLLEVRKLLKLPMEILTTNGERLISRNEQTR